MASGKTTYGNIIAKEYGLQFIDLDQYIEARQFKSVSQIFAEVGESGFREIEKNMLHEVAQFENVVIAAGGGTPCFFDNMQYMNQCGETVYLKATPAELCSNLKKNGTDKRPLVRDKSDEELLDYVSATLSNREAFYSMAKHVMNSSSFTVEGFSEFLKDTK